MKTPTFCKVGANIHAGAVWGRAFTGWEKDIKKQLAHEKKCKRCKKAADIERADIRANRPDLNAVV